MNGKEFLVDGNLLDRKVLQDFCERHILSSESFCELLSVTVFNISYQNDKRHRNSKLIEEENPHQSFGQMSQQLMDPTWL